MIPISRFRRVCVTSYIHRQLCLSINNLNRSGIIYGHAKLNRLNHCNMYSSYNSGGKEKHKNEKKHKMRGHILGGGLVAAFAAGLVISPSFKEKTADSLLLLERVGVVTVAMTRCFSLYLWTLQKDYESESEYFKALSNTHKRAAEITLHALRTNGGIYIKLGQHISALTYLLPPEWTETMTCLQSECPESTLDDIKQMFETDTGIKFDDYFAYFDSKPIGVASLAQVHKATLKETGQQVAVKLQHPSLAKFVPLDVALTKFVFEMMYKVFPEYPLTWLGDEMQESIFVELDFRYEAKNAKKTQEYFKNYLKSTALKVPDVYTAKRRILIMEFIGGARLDDLNYIDSHHISRAEVCGCLAHIFNNMIFKSGFVHCDPHHGNIAIRHLDKPKHGHNFEIVLYDHGLYRTIPNQMKVDYSKFWLALIDKNQNDMKIYGKRFAKIDDNQFPLFAAAITGRDFDHALNGDLEAPRSQDEIEKMKNTMMDDGMVVNLMSLLATVPRIVLLILKTNDLVRHLDESLQNPLGQERTFVIMAKYCADTVYRDDLAVNSRIHRKWSILWITGFISSIFELYRRNFKLFFVDLIFFFNNWFHL